MCTTHPKHDLVAATGGNVGGTSVCGGGPPLLTYTFPTLTRLSDQDELPPMGSVRQALPTESSTRISGFGVRPVARRGSAVALWPSTTIFELLP